MLVFHLLQHRFDRRFRLPLPVQTRHAAGEQLTGLGLFSNLGFQLADTRFHQRTVFSPQIEIPTGGQAKGTVGVPRAGIAVGVGSKRSHQAFGRHALAFNIGGEIHLRAKIRLRHSRLRFGKPDALFGNLHIRRVGQRSLNQIIKLWVMVIFPPVSLRPAIFHGGREIHGNMGGWNLLLRRISNLMRWRAASQRDGQGQCRQHAFI